MKKPFCLLPFPYLLVILFTWLASVSLSAQTLTDAQLQALNSPIIFMNASVGQSEKVMEGLKDFYEQVQYIRQNNKDYMRPYRCVSDLPEYEFGQIQQKSAGLGAMKGKTLEAKSGEVWKALQQLDEHCKALEVYIRLGDYKSDSYAKFDELLRQMEKDFDTIREKQQALTDEVTRQYRQLQPYNANNAYHRLEKEMLVVLANDRNLLQPWTYHFTDKIATGFPMETLVQSINDIDKKNYSFQKAAEKGIQYPASSAAGSFDNAIQSIQQVKKDAIDKYSFDARQSDKYSNQVYADLFNYYNNDMVASYNSFVNYSRQSGQRLLLYPELLPVFRIQKQEQQEAVTVQPFDDKQEASLAIKKQSAPIIQKSFSTLNLYVDFINESVRSVNNLINQLRFYDIHESDFKGRKKLNYLHEKFSIPLSFYQSAINAGGDFPEGTRKTINTQAEVLLNILKEMDQLGIELATHAQKGDYQRDDFFRVSQIRDRYQVLFNTFDERKEKLYTDVQKIFEAYPATQPTGSWYVSGKALRQTVDLDKEILFGVRDYIKGNNQVIPKTEKLEASIRSVIANEYTNMKGIQRIGRNNGLCPYNPYEDIPDASAALVEDAKKITKPASSYSRRPYDGFMYRYNDIVYEYNKFAELAKTPILKNIMQPDVFVFKQPYRSPAEPLISEKIPEETKPAPKPEDKPETNKNIIIHDTVKVTDVQRIETLVTDTVFIERAKVDTVFITETEKDFFSMKGYATNNMILLLDVSSSMAAPQKLPLLKQSIRLLLQMLRPEDEIGIVVYSGEAKVALQPTSAKDIDKIIKVIDKLRSDGATNGNEGIKMAYKVAGKNYKKGGNNRIILASDGEFPISGEVYELATREAEKDIYLSVFNFGNNKMAASSLQSLSTKGKGQYEHITLENANVSLVRQAKAKKKQ
ncbi:VWA domain-containing protein [Rhodocytophaga rosea]|uniref:VWA domain-containing protein n=1 Tax=Rhodocytophaga rosea TaxID=2704465 RepID=A0A6C0GPR3_9BACT|nr:VWA domain-containing protein [Rhodocytophaga rosea]QHT70055.1 VWA domain-containing protein [Rhodocytophaga rosea]